MIETQAIVVQVHDSVAYVRAQFPSGCSSCSADKGCASLTLSKIFNAKPRQYRVLNLIDAKVGDAVVIGLQEGALLKGAISVYLLPLALLLVGAVAGYYAVPGTSGDAYSVIGALLGIMLGVAWLKYFTARISLNSQFHPLILRKAIPPLFHLIKGN